MPPKTEPLNRIFIVTVGRTGSSLLASILAEAGADFGLPADPDWAHALSEVTGLEAASLLAARDKMRRSFSGSETTVVEPFPECRAVYDELRKQKGIFFPASRPAKRAMQID